MSSRMKENFQRKLAAVVAELQPMLSTNQAYARNAFPRRVTALIAEMNADIIREQRTNQAGKKYEHLTIKFKDGAKANYPTMFTLHKPIEQVK